MANNYPHHYSGHPPPQGYGGGANPYQSVPQGGYQHQTPPQYNQGYQNHFQGSSYGGPPQQGHGYMHMGSGAQNIHSPQRPPNGPPQGIDPTIWEWFKSVDADQSGQISAIELRQALVNSNWSHFNEETCRILIGMFDKDGNGTIDVHEFVALWKYVQDWKGCFDRFDTDRSGNISANELQNALSTFGYRLSINFCQLCTRVFNRADSNSMKFDDFIQCCTMLRSLTESFKRLDVDKDGVIDVSYEQFLEMVIDNTAVN